MTVVVPTAARERADRIRAGLEKLAPDLLAAWESRDWEALGYSSWQDYVLGEFGGQLRLGREERRETVKELRAAGMSTRAIGAAVGADQRTVASDIRGAEYSAPAAITGTDGKTYPAQPAQTPTEFRNVGNEAWTHFNGVLSDLEALSSVTSTIALAVPTRRRAATARRLRKLGIGLGRIAWKLEGMESAE